MRKREIKKSVVTYEDRERSRQVKKEVVVDDEHLLNRKARIEAMRRNRVQQEEESIHEQFEVKIEQSTPYPQQEIIQKQPIPKEMKMEEEEVNWEPEQEAEEQKAQVLHRPIFLSREHRDMQGKEDELQEEERKRKNLRYTTKLLLEEDRNHKEESENEVSDSEGENQTDIPDDDDSKNEKYEYQLWRIRELKRIRREKEERQRSVVEKVQLERRRHMNNQDILLQNRLLGSDATEQTTETKYVFMQKYYHKGAFYQDSDDPVFQRDYNLPTPMEMQDKSMLPLILQKRMGNFGKKGQSKHTHLTEEDTTNHNPLTRPDESLMAHWKKKTGGYKGNGSANI